MTWQPNKLEQERIDKLNRLREKGIDPFPPRVERTHTAAQGVTRLLEAEAIAASTTDGDPIPDIRVIVAGRLRQIRFSGKVGFADLEDGSGKIQLFVRQDAVGEATYDVFRKELDLFDFVQAEGALMRTRAGEISINVSTLTVLAKAVSPLPVIKTAEENGQTVTYGGFTDIEERYRQRYVDLATNVEIRELFRTRARLIKAIRNFLDDEGMLEVETPVLQPLYGGAAARPFVTHHNQLKQDLYLRISFELYLKRLIVGGFDAVYEIGRDFRNEGISFKHNTEFTMLEFYKAYTDYRGVADVIERLIKTAVQQATGSLTFTSRGNTVELGGSWQWVTMREAILEKTGIDYNDYPTVEALAALCREKGVKFDPNAPWGKLVEELFSEFVEPTLIQPTFIADFPRDISPFAKALPGDPRHVERFELYVGGVELGNAFTELNDPLDQEQRFLDMAAMYREGQDDLAPLDEDFLRAMRYGMPPMGGLGIGIDRLMILLTGKDSIREVILFPHLREKSE